MSEEIEVRFLEVNKADLVAKLRALKAKELQDVMLEEIIFYDKDLTWSDKGQRVRIRKNGDKIQLDYKKTVTGLISHEVEFLISDINAATLFLESIGLVAHRRQQKERHSFRLGDVMIDIDTWPQMPPYVELEGDSEAALKDAARQLGLDWQQVVLDDPRKIIKEHYAIPYDDIRWFTFDRVA